MKNTSRREFLKRLGAAAASFGVMSTPTSSCPDGLLVKVYNDFGNLPNLSGIWIDQGPGKVMMYTFVKGRWEVVAAEC